MPPIPPAVAAMMPPMGTMRIRGAGLRGFKAPARPAAVRQQRHDHAVTGGSLRGVLVRQPVRWRRESQPAADGARRPAAPRDGRKVVFDDGDGLPMTVTGGPLRTMRWQDDANSAQVKSAVLLAGLVSGRAGECRGAAPSRDHTERFLTALGADVRVTAAAVSLTPPERLRPFDLTVPGDPSSAAFFAALAAMASGGTIRLPACPGQSDA